MSTPPSENSGQVIQPQHTGLIEVDSSDADSTFGDESTYSSSVTSSVYAYRMENGRRYHAFKDGSYLFPNDETENNRLDLQHEVFVRSLNGRLYMAPLASEEVQDVLDIGTGTGIWAIEVADIHPGASVLGTDLSPIQPSFIPPNCSFLIDDAEADWAFKKKFDLIHGRMLTGSFKDWDRFYKQCYDNLKPGGYVEMHDIRLPLDCDDDTMPPSSALYKWGKLFVEGSTALDRPLDATKDYARRMRNAGFEDVTEVVHKWPQNPWAKDPNLKEIGLWTMFNMLDGLQGLTMRPFVSGLGWTAEEVEVFLVDVRNDVKDRAVHSYWPMHFIYGRKPLRSDQHSEFSQDSGIGS